MIIKKKVNNLDLDIITFCLKGVSEIYSLNKINVINRTPPSTNVIKYYWVICSLLVYNIFILFCLEYKNNE